MTADRTFVTLTDGVTHFRREGPSDGQPIVLLHGATVPCWEFDVLVPLLCAGGLQVLRYDLYGHGHSGRLAGDYSLARLVRQATELVEATQFPQPAIWLGHSLGAAIASAVAAAHPEWVKRLILVAPMLDFNASMRWSRLFRWPGVGELLMRFVGLPALVRRRRARYLSIGQPHLIEWFVAQATYDVLGRAVLSMARTATLGDQGPRYAALRDLPRDMLLVWGSEDPVIPRGHIARIRDLLPEHSYHEIEGAEHNLLLTHADAIAGAVLDRKPA